MYTTNHASFPIQIHKITAQICGDFWGTQHITFEIVTICPRSNDPFYIVTTICPRTRQLILVQVKYSSILYVQEVLTQFILFSLKNQRFILVQVKYFTILYVQELLTHFILYIVHKIIFILGMILPRPNSSMSSAWRRARRGGWRAKAKANACCIIN